jgi:hypothetical protein
MDSEVLQLAFEVKDDSASLLEYFASLPCNVQGTFLKMLIEHKYSNVKAQKAHHKKYVLENGVSRGWAYVKDHPESRERKKQYMREYYQRRKRQRVSTS